MPERILDSGNRRDFGTGAVRDMSDGSKGRTDLLPWDVLFDEGMVAHQEHPTEILEFCSFLDKANRHIDLQQSIRFAIDRFTYIAFEKKFTNAILAYAIHMEAGCQKYGDRNWEAGIPINVYLDSAGRHFLKWLRKDTDEAHDRAVIWNLYCALWTIKHRPEMIDAPVGGRP
jgi:hypothetical protein